jgi:antitoxin component YwqK of YwqJK toxin-antitoxin module
MAQGKRIGSWTVWHANGQKHEEAYWVRGFREGRVVGWYANGQMRFDGTYRKGRLKRGSKWWDKDGNPIEKGDWPPPGVD